MGLFISFEGIEGCGKTTQIELLGKFLESRGLACILTREPGGTAVGEAIREIFLRSSNTALIPLTELLLVTAARAQHIQMIAAFDVEPDHRKPPDAPSTQRRMRVPRAPAG